MKFSLAFNIKPTNEVIHGLTRSGTRSSRLRLFVGMLVSRARMFVRLLAVLMSGRRMMLRFIVLAAIVMRRRLMVVVGRGVMMSGGLMVVIARWMFC
jgi:hypothetical protein